MREVYIDRERKRKIERWREREEKRKRKRKRERDKEREVAELNTYYNRKTWRITQRYMNNKSY